VSHYLTANLGILSQGEDLEEDIDLPGFDFSGEESSISSSNSKNNTQKFQKKTWPSKKNNDNVEETNINNNNTNGRNNRRRRNNAPKKAVYAVAPDSGSFVNFLKECLANLYKVLDFLFGRYFRSVHPEFSHLLSLTFLPTRTELRLGSSRESAQRPTSLSSDQSTWH